MDDERHSDFKQELTATLSRLKAAGVIVDFGYGPGSDHLWIEYGPATLAAARRGRALIVDPALWVGVGSGREPRWLGPVLDATLADAVAAEIEGRDPVHEDEA
jgi:hypothetical protein